MVQSATPARAEANDIGREWLEIIELRPIVLLEQLESEFDLVVQR